MAEETKTLKWEGKVTADLKTTKAEKLWSILLQDFCNIHKWAPSMVSCTHVEGVHGEPGLVRYCTLKALADEPDKWCYETLLSVDHVKRSISYKMTENTLGFSSYVAENRVIDVKDGCKIEMSFKVDPIEGMILEDLCGYIESLFKGTAENIENVLKGATS